MDPDTLAKVPEAVFGVYKPKLCIVSTPNVEFNANFKELGYGVPDAKFRHPDHKFEWTRAEFQDWYYGLTQGE